jgi:hypothetical protein
VLRIYYGYPLVVRDNPMSTLYNRRDGYGYRPGERQDQIFSALFNSMGTQRSSREGLIRRPYEFLYELFAQYIKDGGITLNIPENRITWGKKAWGRPTSGVSLKPEFRTEGGKQGLEKAVEGFESEMAIYFDNILTDLQGKILTM